MDTAGASLMEQEVWFSRRVRQLHVVILIVVPAFLALCLWQVSRAARATA